MRPIEPSTVAHAEPSPIYWPCQLQLAGGGTLLVIRDVRPALEAILGPDVAALGGVERVVACAALLAAVSWPAALSHLATGARAEGSGDEEVDHGR